MRSHGPIPSDPEIRVQLERILASEVFSRRTTPGKILRFVVQKAMAAETIKEKDIAAALFSVEDYSPNSNPVRVNATYMRNLLRQYNQTLGLEDPVKIRFPEPDEGEIRKPQSNYVPLFSYIREHPDEALLHEARQRTVLPTPFSLDRMYNLLVDLLQLTPNYYDGLIEMVEICVANIFFDYYPPRAAFGAAEEYLRRAARLQPNNWRTHAAAGALALAGRHIQTANHHFDRALEIDSLSTQRYRWYYLCLLANQQSEEAEHLMRSWLIEGQGDCLNLVLFAFILHACGRNDESFLIIQEAIKLAPDYSVALIAEAVLLLLAEKANYPDKRLQASKFKLAWRRLRQAARLNTPFQWFMPGLVHLIAKHPNGTDVFGDFIADNNLLMREWLRQSPYTPRKDEFFFWDAGCVPYRVTHMKSPINKNHVYVPWPDLQGAIAYVADGTYSEAPEYLDSEMSRVYPHGVTQLLWAFWRTGSPLIMFLDLFGIFRELESDDQYATLRSLRFTPAQGI